MGKKYSKYSEECTKLREGLKVKWPKKLKEEHLALLSRLQVEYMGRFRYGLAGHNNCYVEVPAYDDWIEEIFKILRWESKSTSLVKKSNNS